MTDDEINAATEADDRATERWREERARVVDPLCPSAMHGDGWEPRCVCRRLRRAREETRADERAAAAGRVERALDSFDFTPSGSVWIDVLAAIRGGSDV